MSKVNAKVPVLGQPVFVISENDLDNKIGLSDGRGYFTGLRYFAHDAILVKGQRYTDDTMNKIVINEGMVDEADEKKSLELVIDLERNFTKTKDATTVFFDEEDAVACAAEMNKNQRTQCKKLADLAVKALNTYDDIIAACKIK